MSPRIMTSMYGLGIDSQPADQMADGLARVETGLREAVRSDYPFVTEASRHLVDAGGKRFRPLLVLLAAQYGDPRSVGVVPAAIVVAFLRRHPAHQRLHRQVHRL